MNLDELESLREEFLGTAPRELRLSAWVNALDEAERHTKGKGKHSALGQVALAIVTALRDGREWGRHHALSSGVQGAAGPGAAQVVRERLRQVRSEGWTTEHDDGHEDGALARAAACYAARASGVAHSADVTLQCPACKGSGGCPDGMRPCSRCDGKKKVDAWPDGWADKRPCPAPGLSFLSITDRQRALEKAGALCAAEWDRLERVKRYRPKGQEKPAGGRLLAAAHALGERCMQLIDRRGSVTAGDEESARQLCRAFAEAYRRAVLPAQKEG